MNPDPISQFQQWFDQARETDIDKPNAMTLSTVNPEGAPSSRIVLLSRLDGDDFIFHTNYLSRKGLDMDHDPRVALLFWWDELGYQVRVEGRARRLSGEDSDTYFAARPRGSQIGAWASEQSQPIADRAQLLARVRQFEEKFNDSEVPRPPHWGGYRVSPERIEFWINGEDRLHDRFLYLREEGKGWSILRLAP